jgi:hypothetical protein
LGRETIVTVVLELMAEYCSSEQMRSIKTDAIYESARSGNSEVMQLLLDGMPLSSDLLLKAFGIACVSGRFEAVLPLLNHDDGLALSTEDVRAGLITSAGQGYTSLLRLLCDRLKKSSLTQETLDVALNIASLNGHLETVEFLLRESANPNTICRQAPKPKIDKDGQRPKTEYDYEDRTKRTSLEAALHGCWECSNSKGSRFRYPREFVWRETNAAEREDLVNLLIQSGADANLAVKSYLSGWEDSAILLNYTPEEMLMSYPASLLHIAVRCCSAKVV